MNFVKDFYNVKDMKKPFNCMKGFILYVLVVY